MITAATAAQNVLNHRIKQFNKIAVMCDIVLEEMEISIEYHSQQGLSTLAFAPYDKSRFSSDFAMKTAHDIFEKVFEENGYTIEYNDISLNSLKIRW